MNFSDLPPELRQDIWELTFEPRILCIHMYRRIAPTCNNQNGDWEAMDDISRRTLAISFTCTALHPQRDENIVPNDVYQERANMLPTMKRFKAQDIEAVKKLGTMSPGPTSLGPVSLYVCRESRAVARKRYEFTFKGVNICLPRGSDARNDWIQKRLSQRGIWVDFKRDIVFIDSIAPEDRRNDVLCPTLMFTELGWFAACAKEEVEKITRLAIGGRWSRVPHIKRTLGLVSYNHIPPPAHPLVPSAVKPFRKLRELLLDDGFFLPRRMRTSSSYFGIEGDRRPAEAEIMNWLCGYVRTKCIPKSFWKSLEVRILRGMESEWNEL